MSPGSTATSPAASRHDRDSRQSSPRSGVPRLEILQASSGRFDILEHNAVTTSDSDRSRTSSRDKLPSMDLDRRVCERARLSRDARFDGRFFIGVTTTGIYCRPICPARSPKDENVIYFQTAAAAEAAGFRPCLRCRPEASPGTPAWIGTSGIVSRGLRLIGEGALRGAESGDRRVGSRSGTAGRATRRDRASPATAVLSDTSARRRSKSR